MSQLGAQHAHSRCAGRPSRVSSISCQHSTGITPRPRLDNAAACSELSKPLRKPSYLSRQRVAASGNRDGSTGSSADVPLDSNAAGGGSKAGTRWSRARSGLDRIRGGAGSELNRWRGAQKQVALAADLSSGPQLSSKHASSPSSQQRSASSGATSSSGSQNGNTAGGSPDKSAVWTPSSMPSEGAAFPAAGAAAAPPQQQQRQPLQRPRRAGSNGGGGANGSRASSLVSSTEQPYPQPAGDVLLELRGVYKSFGAKDILAGASMQIRRGEAVGIIGGSGTGKSTTLRLMAGLLAPDRGEVVVQGVPRRGLASDDTSIVKGLQIGMVFQSGALFDSLSVGENVGFLLYEHSSLPEARIKELVARSLAAVGLSGVEALLPSELSGGMKKRVALARAIIRDDENDDAEQVIMYDEPTAGLDPVASTVVEDLIRSLHVNKGGTAQPTSGVRGGISSYIVVTHQHSTIRRSVDRLIFLHEGVVVWTGTNQEFEETEEPIVKQFRTGSLGGPIKYE